MLRGLAALAVFGEHLGLRCSALFTTIDTQYFQLGQFGVTIFFLCSGFIMPGALERHGSLQSFWVGRFFRLYPLYWGSLFAALALAHWGRYTLPAQFATEPGRAVLANMTMLQTAFGVPDALSPYWTLLFELVFYGILSALFVARRLHHTAVIAATLLGMLMAVAATFPLAFGLPCPTALIAAIFYLATLFVGTLVPGSGRNRPRPPLARLVAGAVPLSMLVLLAATRWGPADPDRHGRSFLPFVVAWAAAYLLFAFGQRHRTRTFPRAAIYVGTISYSLYLLHPLVLAALPSGLGVLPTVGTATVATLVLAAISYHWIEAPGIRVGRYFAAYAARANRHGIFDARSTVKAGAPIAPDVLPPAAQQLVD